MLLDSERLSKVHERKGIPKPSPLNAVRVGSKQRPRFAEEVDKDCAQKVSENDSTQLEGEGDELCRNVAETCT